MNLMTATSIALGFAVLTLTGCSGPTVTGIENRDLARKRIDIFNAQLSYDQAEQCFQVGRFDRALRQVESAIAQYDVEPQYYLLLGRIYLETHQLENALKSFDLALEQDETFAEADYFAGIVAQRWSDNETAFDRYSQAFAKDGTSVQYLRASVETLVAMGRYDEATTLLDEQLAYFEHNAGMYHLLGQVALLSGRTAEAVAFYEQAHLLVPNDKALIEELARAQYAVGMFTECHATVTSLQMGIEVPRQDLMMLEARCLAMLNRGLDARNLYIRMSQTEPSNVNVWIELGTVAWSLGDYHRVAQCSNRITSLSPDRFEGYMLKGINERHYDRNSEALEAFEESATLSMDSSMPHILLGMAREKDGDMAGARIAYENALEIDPSSSEAAALFSRIQGSSRVTTASPTN